MNTLFQLRGTVVKGHQIGRTLGFPTANIQPEGCSSLPEDGVYIATLRVLKDGERYHPALLNQGRHPTLPDGARSIEMHLLDFVGDLYGESVEVAYLQRLRPEAKFASKDELAAQIARDVEAARTWFDEHRLPQKSTANDSIVLEGLISVEAAIDAGNRNVFSVHIDREKLKDRRFALKAEALVKRARAKGIPVEHVDSSAIEALAGGRSHGGVAAIAGHRRYQTIDGLLGKDGAKCIMIIEGLEDPFNYGSSVRSVYAAGVDSLIVAPRDWRNAEGTILKSSAGAFEYLDIAVADDVESLYKKLRARNFSLVCMMKSRISAPLYAHRIEYPVLVVIGGEKRGISKHLVERADAHLEIPYGRKFGYSLTSTASASIVAFYFVGGIPPEVN